MYLQSLLTLSTVYTSFLWTKGNPMARSSNKISILELVNLVCQSENLTCQIEDHIFKCICTCLQIFLQTFLWSDSQMHGKFKTQLLAFKLLVQLHPSYWISTICVLVYWGLFITVGSGEGGLIILLPTHVQKFTPPPFPYQSYSYPTLSSSFALWKWFVAFHDSQG